MKRHIIDVGMLFASKSGAVLVGVVFLPWYMALLGETLFGILAVILSFQALLLMLDLGMATLLARDIAARRVMQSEFNARLLFKQSEFLLMLFYLSLLCLLVAWYYAVHPQYLDVLDVLGIVLLFLTLVQQNVALSALVALKQYVLASSIQMIGVTVRAFVTVMALQEIAATLSVFIWSQVVISLFFWAITRLKCKTLLPGSIRSYEIKRGAIIALFQRGKPLLMVGLAGAAVMQLDKPLVLYYLSASEVGAYFLAVSFAMLPLLILAAPVAQFFQPRVTEVVVEKNYESSCHLLWKLLMALVCCVVFPSMLVWFYRDELLMLWLHDAELVKKVSAYVSILIWGSVIGALGYIPYQILIGLQDFSFQAKLSTILTIVTLFVVAICASMGRVDGVCVAYLFYHFATVICSGFRAWMKFEVIRVER